VPLLKTPRPVAADGAGSPAHAGERPPARQVTRRNAGWRPSSPGPGGLGPAARSTHPCRMDASPSRESPRGIILPGVVAPKPEKTTKGAQGIHNMISESKGPCPRRSGLDDRPPDEQPRTGFSSRRNRCWPPCGPCHLRKTSAGSSVTPRARPGPPLLSIGAMRHSRYRLDGALGKIMVPRKQPGKERVSAAADQE